MIEITVFNSRDNAAKFTLTSDGQSIAHNSLTRVQIKIGAILVDSNVMPALFTLVADSISIKLGLAGIQAGRYAASIIAFDSTNTNGIVFGDFVAIFKNV